MLMKIISFLLLMTTVVKGQGCAPYSSYADHTMCIYEDDACPGKILIRSGNLTCLEKQEVLGKHNKFRRQLALSMVPVQPNAANLAEMVWDEELANIAQRWADQCTFASDENRQVDRFLVGQNVYQSSQPVGNDDITSNFAEATQSLFNEYFYFYFSSFCVCPCCGSLYVAGMAESWALGCGFTVYDDESTTTKKLYICNYGPTGSVVGDSMYKIGPPNCPYYGMEPSMNYTGLCVVTDTNPPGIEC